MGTNGSIECHSSGETKCLRTNRRRFRRGKINKRSWLGAVMHRPMEIVPHATFDHRIPDLWIYCLDTAKDTGKCIRLYPCGSTGFSRRLYATNCEFLVVSSSILYFFPRCVSIFWILTLNLSLLAKEHSKKQFQKEAGNFWIIRRGNFLLFNLLNIREIALKTRKGRWGREHFSRVISLINPNNRHTYPKTRITEQNAVSRSDQFNFHPSCINSAKS